MCLFREDLGKIAALIDKHFEIIEVDDKINKTSDTFGYMSVHYLCRIKQQSMLVIDMSV